MIKLKLTDEILQKSFKNFYEEITSVNKIDKYGTFSSTINENQSCSICLEIIKNGSKYRKLYCNHYFHKKCIDKWFSKGGSCPYCRQ